MNACEEHGTSNICKYDQWTSLLRWNANQTSELLARLYLSPISGLNLVTIYERNGEKLMIGVEGKICLTENSRRRKRITSCVANSLCVVLVLDLFDRNAEERRKEEERE